MNWKWLYCKGCRRIFKNKQDELLRHVGCPSPDGPRKIRPAGNESFWHCLYRPELLVDWAKIKWEDFWRKPSES